MTARTDIHSPLNLVTEDYTDIYYGDNQSPWVMVGGDHALAISRHLATSAKACGLEGRGVHQCWHCGANLRYFAVLEHTPTGNYIVVGETCLANRFDRSSAEFHQLREAAALDRAEQAKLKAYHAYLETLEPDGAFLFGPSGQHIDPAFEAAWACGFVSDVRRKVREYGSASPKQLAAVLRVPDQFKAKAAADAQRAAQESEAQPVLTGTVAVTGEVLATKLQDGYYGSTLKMLVLDDRKFKVWGTVPSALETGKGDRVTFTATVEASKDDPCFGYFKRPRGAKVLQAA